MTRTHSVGGPRAVIVEFVLGAGGPDVVVTSKALGGGVPLSAVLAPATLAEEARPSGFLQAASHQGDPFQRAVALANLDVIEHEDLLRRATKLGELLGRGLAA